MDAGDLGGSVSAGGGDPIGLGGTGDNGSGGTSAASATQVANVAITTISTVLTTGVGMSFAGPPGAVAGAIAGLALSAGTQGPTAFAGSVVAVAQDLARGAAIAATSPGIFATDSSTASNFAAGGDGGEISVPGAGSQPWALEVGTNGNFALFVDQTAGW